MWRVDVAQGDLFCCQFIVPLRRSLRLQLVEDRTFLLLDNEEVKSQIKKDKEVDKGDKGVIIAVRHRSVVDG